jgi:hypothetical protein
MPWQQAHRTRPWQHKLLLLLLACHCDGARLVNYAEHYPACCSVPCLKLCLVPGWCYSV